MTFEDITSVETEPLRVTMDNTSARFVPNGQPIRFLSEIPGAVEWAETLFRQRDEAIEARDALARRVAELGLENGRLRSRLIEAGLVP